ncbi:MAG: hypothetical protein AMXMBFR34_54070 [Myxococcaceae bacterium]
MKARDSLCPPELPGALKETLKPLVEVVTVLNALVEASVGLVPGEMSSGEKQRRGHITKTGNTRMRELLHRNRRGPVRDW